MALPTIAEIDAAVPAAGTPSRALTNAALKGLREPLATMPAAYLGQVATRCQLPQNTNAGLTVGMTRTTHYARDKMLNPTVVYPVYRMANASETAFGSGTLKVALEYPVGVYTLSNENIANGNNPVNAPNGNSFFTFNVTVPKGAVFFMRVYQQAAGGILWTQVAGGVDSAYGSAPTDGMEIGTSLNDKTTSGTISFANGISYFPIVIAAQTTQPSVIVFGTSREVGGVGYITDTTYDMGPTTRIVSKSYGCTQAAISGTLLSQWNSGTHTYLNQLIAAGYWSHATNEYGVNDVPGSTAAVVATARATFATSLKAQKSDIVLIGTTLYPYVTTSDVGTTKSGQTIGTSGIRILTLNDAIRSGIAGENFFWDMADGMDPFREGKYPVTRNPADATKTLATFTGAIAGTTLTVTGITGAIFPGDPIHAPSGVLDSTYVVEQLTGTTGSNGTYRVNRPYNGSGTYPKGNVAATAMTTSGLITRDGLHAQWFGEEMIIKNVGPALLDLIRR